MCRYIGASQRKIPEKSALKLTGSVEKDVSKNIYDLAGNCWEWTMEAENPKYRVRRGGSYDYAAPVRHRYHSVPTYYTDDISFRPALYIK